jgi:hypothetical protein
MTDEWRKSDVGVMFGLYLNAFHYTVLRDVVLGASLV